MLVESWLFVAIFLLSSFCPLATQAGAAQTQVVSGQGGFTDNFSSDASLNTALWTTQSDLLNRVAAVGEGGNQCFSLPNNFMPPILNFGPNGMQMSGTNGWQQFTGIQSLRTFSPPFTLNTTVTATVANGNPFEIFLVSSDWRQWFSLYGNVNPTNQPYVGIKLGCELFYERTAVGVPYTIDVSVNADGLFGVSLSSGSMTLATKSFQVGTGPFYLVLGQGEGWPNTGGTKNVAFWRSVTVAGGYQPSPPVITSLAIAIGPPAGTYMFYNPTELANLPKTIMTQVKAVGWNTDSTWIGAGIVSSPQADFSQTALDLVMEFPMLGADVVQNFLELGIWGATTTVVAEGLAPWNLPTPLDITIAELRQTFAGYQTVQESLLRSNSCWHFQGATTFVPESSPGYIQYAAAGQYVGHQSQYLLVLITNLSVSTGKLDLSELGSAKYGLALQGPAGMTGTACLNYTKGFVVNEVNLTDRVTDGSGRDVGCPEISATLLSSNQTAVPGASITRPACAPRRGSKGTARPLPRFTSISPAQGPAGTTVTISGTGFNNVTAVTFGNASATYTVVSPTAISATVPDVSYADSTIKALGPRSQVGVTVTVKTASGSADSLFNYTGPK